MSLAADPAVLRKESPSTGSPSTATRRVVSGRIDAAQYTELEGFARSGGEVLIALEPNDSCGAELAGAAVAHDLPRTEWFVTLADRAEAVRLDGEVPVTSALRTLSPATSVGATVAATTSVRFEHSPTITVRSLGEGRVVASGIADLEALMAHGTLGRFVDRLLRGLDTVDTRVLGVGVVGYGPFGGMGYLHGLAATETDGLALVAAADNAPERIEAARADFPELTSHASGASLAADDDVDIAIIATPPKFHAELALELLRAGKHVVVEKPMCLTVADADLLIATAKANDRIISVHQSRRWDRDYLAVKRLMDRGDLGEVFNIETFVGGFEHPCRAWHSEEAISGGAAYDWGSHHIDWIIQLYGDRPAKVLCTTHTRVWKDTTNVDQLSLWMQWANGREATFRQSDVCAIRRPKFHIEGTTGTLEGHYRPMVTETVEPGRGFVDHVSHHAEAPVDLRLARFEGGYGIIESTIPPAPHPGWGFHKNLADHLLLGEPLAVRPEQSRDVVAVLEAGHRSGANGGELIELG